MSTYKQLLRWVKRLQEAAEKVAELEGIYGLFTDEQVTIKTRDGKLTIIIKREEG